MSIAQELVQGPQPYLVKIGENISSVIVDDLVSFEANKIAIVYQPVMAKTAARLVEELKTRGLDAHRIEVPDAEDGKTFSVVEFLWKVLGQIGLHRQDLMVSLGGGAICDVTGFVASTWMRGINIAHIPTTLLAAVDAAIGGKTAINTVAGKNIVGSFHEPKAVFVDLDNLKDLPREEISSGFAEIAKAGFIRNKKILDLIAENSLSSIKNNKKIFTELILRAVKVKAEVVGQDLKENDLRMILNYGHTLAHAIERNERFRVKHGQAVSIGMVFAAELSNLLGKLDEKTVALHRNILTQLELPIGYSGATFAELLPFIKLDKKNSSTLLKFVILNKIESPEIVVSPDPAILASAYDRISLGTT